MKVVRDVRLRAYEFPACLLCGLESITMPKRDLPGILLAAATLLPACGGDDKSGAANAGGAASTTSNASSGAAGQGGSGSQGGSSGPLAFGAVCGSDADCVGNLCLSEQDRGWPGGFCSASCDINQPTCQGMGKCFDVGQQSGLCILTCTMNGHECRSGYACSDLLGDGSFLGCLPACTKDAECPALGACNLTQRICVAPESDCGNGQDDDGDGLIDCDDGTGCKGTAGCTPGNTPTGEPCTVATDCAAAFGDPVCFSETSAGFPKGYCSEYCDLSANDCGSPSAVCVQRNLPSGHGECFRSCATAADCPMAGYTCANAGGGRKACLPACTADSQCESFCNFDKGLCDTHDENCSDGVDNDQDGRSDCEDLDCAATCGPEISAVCGAVPVAQAKTSSDTMGGTSRFSGSCTGSGAHERVFTFTPGALGQVGALKLTLSSTTDQGIYVRSACDDRATELGCADGNPGGKDEQLTVAVVGGKPVSIFVDGYISTVAGPFTLSATFEQAICGDGKALVPEGCDDGNTTSGDGCDASCRVESGFFCKGAASASVGVTSGDTTAGSNAFQGSCTGRGAPERIYSYTPAKNGTLHIALSGPAKAGVYVRTACADAETEIACADTVHLGASGFLDVPVTGGVPLTIFVDGEKPGQQGTFTLALTQ
jgi:cysteine-rich repeat protein